VVAEGTSDGGAVEDLTEKKGKVITNHGRKETVGGEMPTEEPFMVGNLLDVAWENMKKRHK